MKLLAVIIAFLFLLFSGGRPQSVVVPLTPPTEEPATETTAPLHSPLYLEGVVTEDVVQYFNEVCLAAEIVQGGDPSLLQRWEAPIRYCIIGDPTPEDIATLEAFCDWLNTLEGFPGIGASGSEEDANLSIHFLGHEEYLATMGSQFENTDGCVTFWYDNDVIYEATIGIRTDLDQTLRNSVILEELYNGLGPIQDTDLRPDSIIYSGFSQPQQLTAIDELLLRLLYHPRMECGMDLEACRQVIEELYY